MDELHKALKMKQEMFAANDIRIGITTLLLAETYLGMKQFDNAIKYCQQTIKIRKDANHPELIYALECMDDIKNAMKRTCIVCQEQCKTVCSRCGKYWYCSKKHQKIHWNDKHRNSCMSAQ